MSGLNLLNGGGEMKKVGSRAAVFHGNATKTSGGLTRKDLMKNKRGRIVSRRARDAAKRSQNLKNAGLSTRKGVFGAFRKGVNLFEKKSKKSRKSRNSKK